VLDLDRLLNAHAAMRRQARAAQILLNGPSCDARASLYAAHETMRAHRDECATLVDIATATRKPVPALTEADIRSYINQR
jgi:hypothetical protein